MTQTVSNIVVGIGDSNVVKIGAFGDSEETAVDLGISEGGVEFEFTNEHYDVTADNFMGILNKIKTGEKCKIRINMAEASLANIALAMGYPTTAVSSSTLTFGGSSVVTARCIYINVKGPNSGSRKITLYKAVVVGAATHAYKKGDKTIIPLELELLEDTTKSANARYGTIVDTGADTTPPTVAMTTPADGGTVLLNAKGTVLLTFTETNKMDENSLVYGDTIQILNVTVEATPALVAGTIAYNRADNTVTFTPTANWTASDKLVVIVSSGVRDCNGNNMAAAYYGNFSVTAA